MLGFLNFARVLPCMLLIFALNIVVLVSREIYEKCSNGAILLNKNYFENQLKKKGHFQCLLDFSNFSSMICTKKICKNMLIIFVSLKL